VGQYVAGALGVLVAGAERDVALQAGDVGVDLRDVVLGVVVLFGMVAGEALGVGDDDFADRLVVAVVVVIDGVLAALDGEVARGGDRGVAAGDEVTAC